MENFNYNLTVLVYCCRDHVDNNVNDSNYIQNRHMVGEDSYGQSSRMEQKVTIIVLANYDIVSIVAMVNCIRMDNLNLDFIKEAITTHVHDVAIGIYHYSCSNIYHGLVEIYIIDFNLFVTINDDSSGIVRLFIGIVTVVNVAAVIKIILIQRVPESEIGIEQL